VWAVERAQTQYAKCLRRFRNLGAERLFATSNVRKHARYREAVRSARHVLE
jgi:hypothetical protein